MATSFPIFGTGGLWKVASGSGTPSDPFVPAVNISAGAGQLQTPWLGNINGAGYALSNAVILQYSGTGLSHGTSPVGTPLTMASGTSVAIDTSGGTVEAKLPPPAQGVVVYFFDSTGSWALNNFKLTPNASELINLASGSVQCNQAGGIGGAICLDGSNWLLLGALIASHPIVDLADADYTIKPADVGHVLRFNTSSARSLKIDVNANQPFQVGSDSVTVYNDGTGVISIAAITAGTTKIYGNIGGVTTANQTMRLGTSGNGATGNAEMAVNIKYAPRASESPAERWLVSGAIY